MPTLADLRTQANLLRTSAAAKLAEVSASMEREEGETLTTSAAADDWRALLLDWAVEEIEVRDLALDMAVSGSASNERGAVWRKRLVDDARTELAKRKEDADAEADTNAEAETR